jgi:hypothetical protein
MQKTRTSPVSSAGTVTIGEIARRAECPHYRVQYAVRALGIKPVGRVGLYRMFSTKDADRVRQMILKNNEAQKVKSLKP